MYDIIRGKLRGVENELTMMEHTVIYKADCEVVA